MDLLLTQAIHRALGPLQDSVARLSDHMFRGTGMGLMGTDLQGEAVPKKPRKRVAGHLEGFGRLTESFRKSARTLQQLPCREGLEPGETGEVTHNRSDPAQGSPKRVARDTDGDSSSDEDQEAGRPWRQSSNLSDPPETEDSEEEMFHPEELYHPRSSEWHPDKRVADYVASKIRQPLEKEVRARLRAECPRPTLPDRVAATPDLDPKLCTFFGKYVKDPKKGIDRSWRGCQDKLLDVLGPLTQIIQLAEWAKRSNSPLPTDIMAGWAQRAVCLLGNANCALCAERRRSLLIKIDPKLGELSNSEAGAVAQGNLFGDPFLKELSKFVATFSALDKAQSSIKKIFPGKVFGGAGRGRGCSSGRAFQQGPSPYPPRNNGWRDGRQGTFFPNRGRGKSKRSASGGANAPGGVNGVTPATT
ncbi:uncharacterized protein [Pleurodeles waltl]|uniref:uncharacterized protein n=1 Tax=Pleurodeles waltl TaxID=8319 RepID=UPI0037095173